MKNKLFTIQEAATFLGVSTKTLRRWETSGKIIPQRTAGNQRRYTLKELEEIKAGRTEGVEGKEGSNPSVHHSSIPASNVQTWTYAEFTKKADENAAESSEDSEDQKIQEVGESEYQIHQNTRSSDNQTIRSSESSDDLSSPSFLKTNPQRAFLSRFALLSVFLFGLIASLLFFGVIRGGVGNVRAFGEKVRKVVIDGSKGSNGTKEPNVFLSFLKTFDPSGSSDPFGPSGRAVLGDQAYQPRTRLRINVPTLFGKKVTFLDNAEIKKGLSVTGLASLSGGIVTNNADINAGRGRLTASNVIYSIRAGPNISITAGQNPTISADIPDVVTSLQGESGDLTLSAGTDIAISGLTISNKSTLASVYSRGGCSSCLTDADVANALTISDAGNVSGTAIKSGVVSAAYGGTGLTTYAAGDLLYAGSSNPTALSNLSVGTSGQILTVSGGLPVWADNSASYWQLNSGALSPSNTSNDLLLGATATASAKFAFYNVAGGTPTASISAGSTGLVLVGDGTMQSLRNGTLTIGGNTTGDLVLAPRNGNGIINFDVAASGGLQINGTTGATIGTAACVTTVNGIVTGSASCEPGADSWTAVPSSGIVHLANTTMDVLIGGTSTASAKFGFINNNSGTPTATISGNIVLDSAGTIQTTKNQTLTLGGSSTGNIVLTPNNGSGGFVTINGNLNLASGNAYQINGTNVLTSNTLGSGVTISSLQQVGTLSTGTWQATAIGAAYGGTGINTSGSTGVPYISSGTWSVDASALAPTHGGTGQTAVTTGDLLYGNGSNTWGRLGIGSTGQLLTVSGGVPVWTNNPSGPGNGIFGYWQRIGGALSPENITDDLLLGATATTSAKFAFYNVAGGTPTASISATTTGLVLAGDGSIQSLRNGTLTLGGSTTGNIVFRPNNGTGGIVTVNGNLNLASGNAYQINGTNVLTNNTLGSGVTSSSLTTVGALASGSIASGFGTISTGNTITTTSTLTGATVNASSGTIQTGGTNRIDNSGNLVNIGTTQLNSVTYTWPSSDSSTTGYVLSSNASGTLSWIDVSTASTAYWDRQNGTLYPRIASVHDFLLGGQSTASAKFAFKNVNSGTPTATISAQSGNSAVYLTADGTLATEARKTLTIGNSSTYNTTGNVLINPNGVGNVGIGTIAPAGKLDVSGAVTGNALVVFNETGDQNILTASASGTTALSLARSGNLTLYSTTATSDRLTFAPQSGGAATFTGTITSEDLTGSDKTWTFPNATGTVCLTTGNCAGIGGNGDITAVGSMQSGDAFSDSTADDDWLGLGASAGRIEFDDQAVDEVNILSAKLGLGTSTPDSLLHVTGAVTGKALTILNETGDQALFTASASGTTKFTIANNGNITASGTIAGLTGISSSGTIAFSGLSTNGFVKTTGGTGTLSVSSTVNLATEVSGILSTANGGSWWNSSQGALYPGNSTLDLLLGATSTSSAKFAVTNINSGTPTATISATATGTGLVLGGDGTIQSLRNGTLTIGGSTTGNIVLTPNNGSGGFVTINGNVNLTSGNAYQINGTNVLTNNTLGSGVTVSSLQQVGTISTGTWQGTAIGAAYGGTGITTSGSTGVPYISSGTWSVDANALAPTHGGTGQTAVTTGDLLYGNGSNTWGRLGIGSTGQLLTVSGGVPAWTSNPTPPASGAFGYWQRASGALAPYNITDDLLLGATATTSAKFAFYNVAGGTPTASISANSGNNAAYLTGDGTLATTNRGTLTIGNSSTYNTTGNVLINPNGAGNVGIGTTTPSTLLHLNDSASAATSGQEILRLESDYQSSSVGSGGKILFRGTQDAAAIRGYTFGSQLTGLAFDTGWGALTTKMIINNAGNVGINTTSPLATLDVRGNTATTPAASISANSNFAALVVDNSDGGDIFTASSSGLTRFVVKQNGKVGIGTGLPALVNGSSDRLLEISGTTNPGIALRDDSGKQFFLYNDGATFGIWDANNSANRVMIDTNGKIGFGTDSPGAELYVTRPLSFGATGKALGIFDQVENQDIFTASASGATKFVIKNNGNIQFAGSTSVLGTLTSAATAARTWTLPDGSGTICVSGVICASSGVVGYFQRNSGALSPANITDDLLLGGTATSSARFAFTNAVGPGTPVASISATTTGLVLGGDGSIQSLQNGTLTLGGSTTGHISFVPGNSTSMTLTSAGRVGIGTTTPLATLDVRGNLATVPAASVSAVSNSFAAMVVDNAGTGDIFTASASGQNRFVINNNGNVGIGTASASFGLDVNMMTAAFNSSQDGKLDAFATNSNSLPGGIKAHTSVAANGYIYVIGGYNGSALSTVYYAKVNGDGSMGNFVGTTSLPDVRDYHASVVSNGFIYVLGGYSDNQATAQSTVYYAKINADGSVGSWATTTALPAARGGLNSVIANGYIYAIGGATDGITGQTNVYYAKINADGTIGSWGTTTVLPAGRNVPTSVVANGFLYVMGGLGATTVYYAKLNADGTVAAWSTTTALPAVRRAASAVVANGNIYVLGGLDGGGTSNSTVYYAKVNTNGTVGGWATNSNSLPGIRNSASAVIVNGYVYEIGGVTSGSSYQSTVYYASTARVSMAASLDLIGLSKGSIGSASANLGGFGNVGGSIYAGDIFSIGNLEITGNSQFWNGAGVRGGLTADSLLITGNTSATGPVASISANTTFAGFVVNQADGGDIFTASKSGATKFTILNNGNLQFAGTTNFLGTLASAATAAQTWTLPDATGTLCVSGSTCASSGTVGYFQRNGGALSPANITDDLLLGATATTSAKFAFYNVAGGTPTASISANSGANATTLSGLGVLGTTNMQTLTLGNATTGDVVIDAGTGNVQLTDATASRFALTDANKNLIYSGASSVLLNTLTDETGTGVAVFGTSPTFTTDVRTGSSSFDVFNTGATTINAFGAATTLNLGATTGTATIANQTLTLSNATTLTASNLATFTSAATLGISATTLNLGGGSAATIGTVSNDDLTITPNGSGNTILTSTYQSGVRIGSSSNTPAVLSVSGGIANNAAFIVNNTNNGDLIAASASGTTKFVVNNSGDIVLSGTTRLTNAGVGTFITGTVIGSQTFTTNNIVDSGALTIKSGGTSALTLDTSGAAAVNIGNTNATSLVFGNTSTNPTFSFNGTGLATFGGGVTVTGTTTTNGTLTVNSDTITLGNATTDAITFTAGVAQDSDLIPVGTTGTNDLGASAVPWDNLYVGTVTQNGTTLANTYAPINANFVTITANGTLTGETGIDALTTAVSTTSTLNVDSASTLNAVTVDAGANVVLSAGSGKLGVGLTPVGKLDVSGAVTGKALTILDETGDQNILTASASGSTVFNLTRAGVLQAADLTLGLNDTSATISTNDTNEDLTIDPNGTGNITLAAPTLTLSGTSTVTASSLTTLTTGALNLNATGDLTLDSTTDIILDADGADVLFKDNGTTFATFTNSSTDLTLDVAGDDLASADRFTIGSTTPGVGQLNVTGKQTGKALAIFDETGDQNILTASASGTTRLVLTNGGNVGIGNTSPVGLLDVNGKITGKALVMVNETGNQALFTASASGTTRFVITNGGNVGMGTALPALVNGSSDRLLEISGTTNPGVALRDDSGKQFLLYNDGGSFGIFDTNNSANRIMIDTNGKVGIGADTPGYKLDVQVSQSATAAAQIYNTNNGANTVGAIIKLGFTGNGTAPTGMGTGNRFLQFLNGNGLAIGNISANGSNGVRYDTGGADFAEYFKKADPSEVFNPGDVVCYDQNGGVAKCSSATKTILGVISDNAGFVGAGKHVDDPNYVLVGLIGQLQVKISPESGSLKTGDPLTVSLEAGKAQKATKAGQIIGRALEAYDPQSQSDGKILVTLAVGWYDPDVYLTDTGNLNIAPASQTDPVSGSPVYKLMNQQTEEVKRIGAFSDGVIGNLKAGSIDAQSLMLAGISVNDRLNGLENAASGAATLGSKVDMLDNQLSSLTSKIASLEADLAFYASASAMLSDGGFGSFNASSAAELSLDKLAVNEATVSGTLNVLGRATFQDVGITGNVNIGLLTINGLNDDGAAEINTTAGDLKLQSHGLFGLDILNGKVKIEANGDMKVDGEVTVKKLKIDTSDVAGASLGTSVITVGKSKVVIDTSAVSSQSAIFVTPMTKTTLPLAVTSQTAGQGFTVELPAVTDKDVRFRWWVVN